MKYNFTWDQLNVLHRVLVIRLVQMTKEDPSTVRAYHIQTLGRVGRAMSQAAFKQPASAILNMDGDQQLWASASMNRASQDPGLFECTEGNDPEVLESIQQATEWDELDVKVGDLVRSFHFPHGHSGGFQLEPHEHACYIEGQVLAIGRVEEWNDCDRYTIEVRREVFGGKEIEWEARCVYPPVNGIRIIGGLGEVADGVRKIR